MTDHPKTGLRFVLERPPSGPPWEYRGGVYGPTEAWPFTAVVRADGAVDVSMPDAELAEKVRLLLRAAYKHAKKDAPDGAPARKIVRWRGEK
jgi:hypothetical protein